MERERDRGKDDKGVHVARTRKAHFSGTSFVPERERGAKPPQGHCARFCGFTRFCIIQVARPLTKV